MWKTLLEMPQNCDSFATLLKQDLITGVSNYDNRFSLVDHKALSNLKQIMSCIVHWTPVFENVRYLPKFVFPFVKMSKGDLLFAFELVITLLLNHCQLWFEFLPLVDVPYNYLNMVENILMEVDKKLHGVSMTLNLMTLKNISFSYSVLQIKRHHKSTVRSSTDGNCFLRSTRSVIVAATVGSHCDF